MAALLRASVLVSVRASRAAVLRCVVEGVVVDGVVVGEGEVVDDCVGVVVDVCGAGMLDPPPRDNSTMP